MRGFTCVEKNIWSNLKKSQYIMTMIVVSQNSSFIDVCQSPEYTSDIYLAKANTLFRFNPFVFSAPFLYPVKTSENRKV